MLYVVTGGSGSGKSVYAENFLCKLEIHNKVYVATMKAFDEEAKRKIKRHRIMRKEKGFITMECYEDLTSLVIPEKTGVLLECMSNFVANIRYQNTTPLPKEQVIETVLEGVDSLSKKSRELVIVTNEVFSDGIEYSLETLEYMECLGRVNQELAKRADFLVEVVYGISVIIKDVRKEQVHEKNV